MPTPEPPIYALCLQYLREPTTRQSDGTVTFVPPLTAPEQAILDDLQLMAKFGVTMTLAEWQSIKADAAALKAYLGIATPTLAQTAAATKAIVRVLGVIVRS
jgi:hypothetical protein